MVTREYVAYQSPRWQTVSPLQGGAAGTTTTARHSGPHSTSTGSRQSWTLVCPPQRMRVDSTPCKSSAKQGLFELAKFSDAPPASASSDFSTETAGDTNAGPASAIAMKRGFTLRVYLRGCACLTLAALTLTICAVARTHPVFVLGLGNRLSWTDNAPCPAALLGATGPSPTNCTVEAVVPVIVAAGCQVPTSGAGPEANLWSCSVPSCIDGVEQLMHACPEKRKFIKARWTGIHGTPVQREKYHQTLKTLALLAPGLNLTKFWDDCALAVKAREIQRPYVHRKQARHVFAAMLVAVVMGVALNAACKKGTTRYPLHESGEHQTRFDSNAGLQEPGGTETVRGFTLRVHQRRCCCLTLAGLTLATCAVGWRYFRHGNDKAAGGLPCPASLLGAPTPTNCTVEATIPVIIAAGCQVANLWSCSVPSCTDAIEQLIGVCPDLQHWDPQTQKKLTSLAPGLNLTTFADDCTRASQARSQQRAIAGAQLVSKVAGFAFVVTLIAIVIGLTARNRERRRLSEFSRDSTSSISTSSDSSAEGTTDGCTGSGTDNDHRTPESFLTAVHERSTASDNEFPALDLSPLDLDVLPLAYNNPDCDAVVADTAISANGVDTAMDADKNATKHARRKAKLAERAALRSKKLLERVQRDPLLPPDVESALWLGDQDAGNAAGQEAAVERLAKMVADDSPVDDWLHPELLPRINLASKAAEGAMKSLDADTDTAEELPVAVGGRQVSRRESKRPDARHHCPFPGCTYASVGTGHLFRHFKIHTREKPFSCDWPGCNYSTAQPGHLIPHKRGHTGEKPFKCDFPGCDYASARSWHVTRHVRSVHENQDGSAKPLESAAE
eukprot:COSAG02_NODE_1114_length_14502_cov_140.830035_13_plen_843_part_00